MDYIDFLRSKIVTAPETGFSVPESEVNSALKPHQRDAVRWAVAGGRRGLFERFGLGKTAQELEYCRLVTAHEGGKALIVLPLGVRQEFMRDAVQLLGMETPRYVRNMEEARVATESILLTDYERVRDGDIDPAGFMACCLDEASVLRSFGSKTYQTFLDKFRGVRFKLVATATPSPNRYKELIHYAGFLEIMDTGQALTRFFQRDSTKANNLTLYPHKEEEFWLWVSTWGLFLSKPSDLGYDDTGYALPPLDVHTHILQDHYGDEIERDGQVKMMRDAAVSLSEAAREKRESIAVRVAKARRGARSRAWLRIHPARTVGRSRPPRRTGSRLVFHSGERRHSIFDRARAELCAAAAPTAAKHTTRTDAAAGSGDRRGVRRFRLHQRTGRQRGSRPILRLSGRARRHGNI